MPCPSSLDAPPSDRVHNSSSKRRAMRRRGGSGHPPSAPADARAPRSLLPDSVRVGLLTHPAVAATHRCAEEIDRRHENTETAEFLHRSRHDQGPRLRGACCGAALSDPRARLKHQRWSRPHARWLRREHRARGERTRTVKEFTVLRIPLRIPTTSNATDTLVRASHRRAFGATCVHDPGVKHE